MSRRFDTPVFRRRIPGSFNRAGALLVLGLVAFATFLGVFGAIHPEPTSAASSTTLTFQARLLNTSGSLVADGTYNVEFKIYDTVGSGASAQGVCSLDSSTDDCWWLETRTGGNKVTVKNGYIYANLGSVTAFSSTIPWDQELWITMNIGGTGSPSWDGEMSPRFKVAAVPYAFAAAKLQVTDSSITNKLVFATPSSSNKTITLPNETGTVCTTGSICSGYQAAGSYANVALSNLSGVAINTALLPGADNTIDLGSAGFSFRTLYGDTSVITPLLTSSAGLAVTGGTTLTLASTGVGNDIIINGADILDVQDNASFAGTLDVTSTVTLTGDLVVNGNTTIGNAVTDNLTVTSAIQGASALVFDGASNNTNEITLAITDPGADFTITLPAETGTVCTTGSVCSGYQASGSYALTALSNLSSVAINTSLLPASDDTIDLGDNTHRFRDLYLGGETLHIGTSTSDEGAFAYTTSTNVLSATSTGGMSFTAGSTGDYVFNTDADSVFGIGTAAPLYNLHVHTSTNGNFAVRDGSLFGGLTGVALQSVNDADNAYRHFNIEGSTVTFNVASGGNVGVGMGAPLKKLDVAGSARFTGTATSVLTGTIDPTASTTVTGVGTLFLTELVVGDRITVNGETRTVTAIASDTSLTVDSATTDTANDTSPDKLSAILVVRDSSNAVKVAVNDQGNVAIGTAATDGATKLTIVSSGDSWGWVHNNGTIGMGSYVDTTYGAWLGTYTNHNLNFFTNNANPSVTLDTSGEFGIGTATPNNKLHVAKDTANLASSAVDADFGFRVSEGTGDDRSLLFGVDDSGGFAAIQAMDSGTSWSTVPLSLMPRGGNVGIGTSAPLLRLDVSGSGRFTGAATSVLTGSINPTASTTVTGVSTLFLTELVVGDRITVSGETRTVTAIATNTSLTVDTATTDTANDTSPDKLAAALVVRDSSSVVKLVVSDQGYVGVGTSAPTTMLTVNGSGVFGGTTAGNDTVEVQGAGAGYSLYDRSTGVTDRWSIYASGGIVRLWENGTGDRFTLNQSGNGTFSGDLTVTGSNLGVGIAADSSYILYGYYDSNTYARFVNDDNGDFYINGANADLYVTDDSSASNYTRIHHSGSHGYIDTGVGDLVLRPTSGIINANTNTVVFSGSSDGIYWDKTADACLSPGGSDDGYTRLSNSGCGLTYTDLAVDNFWAAGALRFDIAEFTPVKQSDNLVPGDIVSADPDMDTRVRRSQVAYDRTVMGIVSSIHSAAMVIGGKGPENYTQGNESELPIALGGRVMVKVSSENGLIERGDAITTSSIAGTGMKITQSGPIIGKSMDKFDPSQLTCTPTTSAASAPWRAFEDPAINPSGIPKNECFVLPNGVYLSRITVFVTPSWYNPNQQLLAELDVSGLAILNTLTVTSAATFEGSLTVVGDAEFQGNLKVLGNTEVANIRVNGKIITAGNAPTVVLGATTTGDGSSYTIEGNDTAGSITITTGTSTVPNPLATGEQAVVTFVTPFATTPRITLTPTTEAAANIKYYITRSGTEFKLYFTTTPSPNSIYSFDYQVIQ